MYIFQVSGRYLYLMTFKFFFNHIFLMIFATYGHSLTNSLDEETLVVILK
jgi:hypothetical protein